jgi:dTDP-4-amino-4,6-dideoxygalactose transaminase
MRNFGFKGYDNVIHPGTNGKMVEVCAAMGLTNLETLDKIFALNSSTYDTYHKALIDIPGISVIEYDRSEINNYHYVVLQVSEGCTVSRDQIVTTLHAENVLARRYFWPGCHRMKPYRDLFPHAGLMLPNTQQVSDHVVVLPAGPSVSQSDVITICDAIRALHRWGLTPL